MLDFDEGTTLERTDAAVREFEAYLRHGSRRSPTSPRYVGLASPMDFNGLVRHYYLRQATTWPRFASTWWARRVGRSRATPSACGCATT